MDSSPFRIFWVHLIFFTLLASPSLSTRLYPTNNVTLLGDTSYGNNSVRLTQDHKCVSSSPSPSDTVKLTTLFGIARVFFVNPIQFLDSSTNATASFSSSFSFTIASTPSCPFGDGFAFLITSNMNSLSISDGCMGLPEDISSSQDSYIAIEFDMSYNPLLTILMGTTLVSM